VSDVCQKLKTIADVEYALIATKNGVPVGDNSYEAETLGAYTQFLANFGVQLGVHFGSGELKSATVHGSEHHIFAFESKNHFLSVSAKGSSNIGALESQIRKVLNPQ
jgi:predicted regulator of Ras-like GTPase activity (Roadblock/LC7/MglB family)